MSKENNDQQKIQDEKLLSLGLNMLKSICYHEPDVIRKTNMFLRQAFVDLSNHKEFDEEDYRYKWQCLLYDLQEVSLPFEDYSQDEIRLALEIASKVLENHKAKMLAEMEVTNA